MRYSGRPTLAKKSTLILPVTGFCGEHPPHTAARIGIVAPVSGNQMDMDVSDGLTGSWAIVDADVVGVRSEFRVENPLLLADELEQRGMLLGRQVEERPNVPIRDDERMAGRDWICIADGNRQGVRCDHSSAFQGAKRAVGRHAPFYLNNDRR